MSEELDELDKAWFQEINRRMEEIWSGKVKTTPWREVQRKGQALLHAKELGWLGLAEAA